MKLNEVVFKLFNAEIMAMNCHVLLGNSKGGLHSITWHTKHLETLMRVKSLN